MNAIVEQDVIEALYKASQAGVEIDLIIRGVCCLRPGIPGISDNIRVTSIIGRFLEHTRVYYFYNDGDEEVFGSSADWMVRNLHKRVESCFPVEDKHLKNRIIKELNYYIQDNCQSWVLDSEGNYHLKPRAENEDKICAQLALLEELADWE